MRLGKFEPDFDDGEVRSHVGQILVDEAVDYAAIDRMIGVNLNVLDTYQPAQLSVICANGVGVPKEAFARMEAGMGQNSMTPDSVFTAPYLRFSGGAGWSKGITHHRVRPSPDLVLRNYQWWMPAPPVTQ